VIDAYASQPHYHDHIWPIWEHLPNRGRLIVHRSLENTRPHDLVGAAPPPDRNPIIVAGTTDLMKTARRPTVFVEHGAGQTYSTQHPGYAGGPGRGRVGLFLCPNEQVAEKNGRVYPQARVEVVGSPRVEWLQRRRADAVVTSREPGDRPAVAFSFHFDCAFWPEARWAFPYYRDTLTSLIPLLKERYEVLGHGHPRAWPVLEKFWERIGVEPVREFTEICERADLYICDNSSTIFEAAAVGIPVILLNQPAYRKNIEIGLRFWEHADIGPQVDDPGDLADTISDVLLEMDRWEAPRSRMVSNVYSVLDGSAHRAAAIIADFAS
jgi:hypothetical protein